MRPGHRHREVERSHLSFAFDSLTGSQSGTTAELRATEKRSLASLLLQ